MCRHYAIYLKDVSALVGSGIGPHVHQRTPF